MRTLTRSSGTTYATEGGGWLVVRRREPALDGKPPAELLARTAALPGSLRYVAGPEGVVLLGEVRSLAAGATLEEARQRFEELLEGTAADTGTEPSEEALEAALEASGFGWARRDAGWAVPAGERLPREIQLSAGPAGVRVETTLAEWDEIGDAERQALARFLLAAQPGLRLARCELDERKARIVSAVASANIDTELGHSLMGVAAGCRLLAREVATLLAPEVARAYLEFQGAQ
jgi:hypothetical protein